jgi:hypothetical protein
MSIHEVWIKKIKSESQGVVEKSQLPKPNQMKRYELENTWDDGSLNNNNHSTQSL